MARPAVFGDLVITTSNGTLRYPQVRCDVLLAARQLVFDKLGSVVWVPDEALGLASIALDKESESFPWFLPAGEGFDQLAMRTRMVLHPGLVDLPVGRSVALLDLWPVANSALLRASGEDKAVAQWLRSMENGVATWKWLDQPVKLTAKSGFITITPQRGRTVLSLRAIASKF